MKPGRRPLHFPPVLNGLDYLDSAVTLLSKNDGTPGPRDLKYAILHLQAAVETLLKARLAIVDPRLVWQNRDDFNEARHKQGDFFSCGWRETIRRLNGAGLLDDELDPKDPALDALAQLRNRMQHLGVSDTALAVENRAIPVLDVLLRFVDIELMPLLAEDVDEAEALLAGIREGLAKIEPLIDHRKTHLAPLLADNADNTIRCPSCGEFAVILDGESVITCRLCEHAYGPPEEAAWGLVGSSMYEVVTGGGDSPVHRCGDWKHEAVIAVPTASHPEKPELICLADGQVYEGICAYCGEAANFAIPEADMCDGCYRERFKKF